MAYVQSKEVSAGDPPVDLLRLEKGRGAIESVYMSFFDPGETFLYAERNLNIYYGQEATPSLESSGTEDFFMASWAWAAGAYATTFHGAPVRQPRPGFVTAYRYFQNPSSFENGVRIAWELGPSDRPESGGPIKLWSLVSYWLENE